MPDDRPPVYCQKAWDYLSSFMDDPMTQDCGCADELMESYWRSHRKSCQTCDERLTEEAMP